MNPRWIKMISSGIIPQWIHLIMNFADSNKAQDGFWGPNGNGIVDNP